MRETMQRSILIIDDEEEFAFTLADRLALRDMKVRVACSGKEGLALIQAELPHLVLLDMRMPELSGIEVLRIIREKYGSLSVLVITGHCSETDYDAAQELGVQGYHSKPLDFEILLANIMTIPVTAP